MSPLSNPFDSHEPTRHSGPSFGSGRWGLLLLLAVLLAGVMLSGGVHELLHDHHDDGGDCLVCHLTGFDPTFGPEPHLLRIDLAPAGAPLIEEPDSRTGCSSARPRAPPAS